MTTASTSPTLDGLFRRSLLRQPQALALVDPADKMRVTQTPPQRLTFAEARSLHDRTGAACIDVTGH